MELRSRPAVFNFFDNRLSGTVVWKSFRGIFQRWTLDDGLRHFIYFGRKSGHVAGISRGRCERNSLKILTGHLSLPVANIFGKKVRGFAESPDCRVLLGFSTNSTYSTPFSLMPNVKSSVCILWCSWRPRSPNCWVISHQTVWVRTWGLWLPYYVGSQRCVSSLVVRLRDFCDHLPLPSSRSCLAFPSKPPMTPKIHGLAGWNTWSHSPSSGGQEMQPWFVNCQVRNQFRLVYVPSCKTARGLCSVCRFVRPFLFAMPFLFRPGLPNSQPVGCTQFCVFVVCVVF